MTYDQAMHWWFARVNYELQSPLPADLKLDRMRTLLERLGSPHERYPIVHIAGSKGKGSTAAMLSAILQRDARRIGLFTSPHLQTVEERVQVNQTTIARSDLAEVLTEIRTASAAPAPGQTLPLDAGLTFFEIATALGFLHFAQKRVDAAIVEVGLGGRFDSTNVCLPWLSIVTSISFDHTQQLGNTLASIAFEKAGIIKADRPVVSGVTQDEARQVIRRMATERHAPLHELDVDFRFEHEPALITNERERWPRVRMTTQRGVGPWHTLGLIGEHQAANAALAVAAVEVLRERGFAVSDEAVTQGLAQVRWPARLEIAARRPLMLLDCAHNVASAEALATALVASFPVSGGGRRRLIFAGNKDKDVAGMLAVLAPVFDAVYLTRFANSPRALPPEQVVPLLPEKLRGAATVCATASDVLQQIRRDGRPEDVNCAAGSVFLAGELRSLLAPSKSALTAFPS